MCFKIICLLFICVISFSFIHAQVENVGQKPDDAARIFLSTFTVILSTVTSTATTTSVTTCTTSAGTLTTCSAGRRRRGLLFDESESNGRSRHGLFYNDDEGEQKYDTISLSNNPKKRSTIISETADASTETSSSKNIDIPLTIQSGFSLPEQFSASAPRFKLAFGTTTLTTTSTSLSTRKLTATCASTTNYATCS